MKKLLIGLVLLASSSGHATEFSFERKYSLMIPENSERIGAIVELKDYLELNPRVANAAVKINNLSFGYKNFYKAEYKAKICFQVGKLDFLSERLEILKKRIISDKVPRLLNRDQSKVDSELLELSNGLNMSLRQLTSFCEGDKDLNKDEIRNSVAGLSTLIHDTAYNISYALRRDNMLAPQASDLYIDYTGAKHEYENPEEIIEKECSIKDLF